MVLAITLRFTPGAIVAGACVGHSIRSLFSRGQITASYFIMLEMLRPSHVMDISYGIIQNYCLIYLTSDKADLEFITYCDLFKVKALMYFFFIK